MKRIRTSALRIFVVLIGLSALVGQTYSAAPQFGPPKDAIIGSWVETVTPTGPGAPPPFKSLGVYHADGTWTFSDQGSVRMSATPPFVLSPSYGVWSHLRDHTFALTGYEMICDLDGNLWGTIKFRGELTVDSTGNRYTSRSRVEVFDPGGNLLFSLQATAEGQRIQLQSQ
jgi:hypothetical protein